MWVLWFAGRGLPVCRAVGLVRPSFLEYYRVLSKVLRV